LKFAISIRYTISKKYLIVLRLKSIVKTQSESRLQANCFVNNIISEPTLLEDTILSILAPSFLLISPHFFRKNKRSHTLFIKGTWFAKIAYVQGNSFEPATIFYTKIIPRCMSSCIWVYSQEKIELIWLNLDHTIEITTLEYTVE